LTNCDNVTDYDPVRDTIQLENAVFTTLAVGVLNATYFRLGAAALDANDLVIYNRATGGLFYDLNANAVGGAVLIAVFTNHPVLSASEFSVV
jgi:Ca2+-binding RTX toxin-like protein